jgi:hypothetical protein
MRFSVGELSKTLLVTHKDCSDGCGCAVVFEALGGSPGSVAFVPAGHGPRDYIKKNLVWLSNWKRIIMADVAPCEEAADMIEKQLGNVTVIDHHKTALGLNTRDWCNIDVSKCGTWLLLDYLMDGDAPRPMLERFAMLTNDRDLWLRQHVMSDEMSLWMDFVGPQRYVRRAMEDFFLGWNESERTVLDVLEERRKKYVDDKSEKVRIREQYGSKIAYVFLTANSKYDSDVLNRVLERHEVDAAVGLKLDGAVVSMRSKDRFDSSEFCKAYGGGGHARAAGHPIQSVVLDEIVDLVHP